MLATMLGFLLAISASNSPDDFWGHWGDGRAELSSYQLTTPRYGELRDGHAVFIFVTEDISRETRIKVESAAIPKAERVPVIKLNKAMKFNTGIYPYSVMTSTFSAVEAEPGRPPLQPMKISFTAQEWCGHVFQMLVPQERRVELTVHSYFEGEGDQHVAIDLPADAVYEDNLPIWIRELRGEVMRAGEQRNVAILPAMWVLRSRHRDAAFEKGWIKKEQGETVSIDGRPLATWKWRWQVGDRTETYWVEQAYPHRILKFASTDGTTGEWLATIREPYWRLNSNDDLPYRDKLKLPR